MAPLFASLVIIFEVGRDIKAVLKLDIPDKNDIEHAHWAKQPFLWFIYMSSHAKINLDVPLNRFLVFSGYYLIFVGLIMNTILDKTLHCYDDDDNVHFNSNHICLSVYAISMIWQGVTSLLPYMNLFCYLGILPSCRIFFF